MISSKYSVQLEEQLLDETKQIVLYVDWAPSMGMVETFGIMVISKVARKKNVKKQCKSRRFRW